MKAFSKISGEEEPGSELSDYHFYLDYLKFFSMVLFGISMTTPVLMLIIFDLDVAFFEGKKELLEESFWDKPILPYVASFFILSIHWLKYTEINNSLRSTDSRHVFINFIYFFLLCLYPYFEISMEYASESIPARVNFSIAWGLLGAFSYLNLFYADKNNLVKKNLHRNRIRSLKRSLFVEPLSAIICIPIAYLGFVEWLVAMIVLLPVNNVLVQIFSRRFLKVND